MTDEKRAKFQAGTAKLSDAASRLNIDTDVYGTAPSWKRSLAEQELERRNEGGELSTLRKENASLRKTNKIAIGAAVVMALTSVFALFK